MQALKNISLYTIETTIETMAKSKAPKKDKMNTIFGIDLVRMATIHIKYMNIFFTAQRLPKITCPKFRGHLRNLACLMGLTHLQEYTSIGFESGYFAKGTTNLINEAVKELLKRLRPQLIPLIELLDLTDNMVCSAIGNSYGDIYEQHLEWAKGSRLNDKEGSIQPGIKEYILPILQGKM